MADPVVAKCGLCCVSFLVFMLILLISLSVKQVDRLNVGLLKNSISGEVDLKASYTAGRYMVGFWWDFVQVPITLNTIEFSDAIPEEGVQNLDRVKARDKDGKQIYMDIAIQYRIKPEKFPQIYKSMTTLFEDIYINDLRSGLQKAANLFRISESWENYSHVTALMKAECDAVLADKHAECWDLQFLGAKLLEKYETQLVRTQVQKQRNIKEEKRQRHKDYRAKTQAEIAVYDKMKTVIQAEADARKVNIERLARSVAEEALVKAQSDVLRLVRGLVVLPPNATRTEPVVMSDLELIQYQRILMLQGLKQANLALTSKGGKMEKLFVP
eukprot:TRINITY_DN58250_c0_g1_i1.p1 TRINITY_DN58250_c0_g1~~TRINITY_DN58250_c0_g1_i1.p1  ORF type:complete len:328 (+),score=59.32 TRINITY_DN58250_c0_g1_i1:130-1113(+)